MATSGSLDKKHRLSSRQSTIENTNRSEKKRQNAGAMDLSGFLVKHQIYIIQQRYQLWCSVWSIWRSKQTMVCSSSDTIRIMGSTFPTLPFLDKLDRERASSRSSVLPT